MDIIKLISAGESETLEFKESLALKDEVGEGVSALSNTSGGMILVGLDDRGEILGVQTGKKTLENMANYIKVHTDNHVFPKLSVVEHEGKSVVAIEIKESDEKPVFFKGKAYVRVGKSRHRLSASEIRSMAKKSGEKVYWDEEVCRGATLADIDEEKVRYFVKEAKRQRNLDLPDTLSLGETLMRLNLQKDERPTNACVLLFAKKTVDFFFQTEAKCIRFKGTDVTGPMIDFKVINEDIITQLKKIEDFIFDHIPMAAWIEDGKLERQEKWLYPPKAIREALANALAHREYETTGKLQVRIFDDRMEIWNPGKLLEPLTFEDLKKTHKSIPRNPLIARCFFWIKYIEEVGTGTNKIVEWCREWKLPEPDFRHVTGDFVTVLKNVILTEELIHKLGLNERQKKAIDYVKMHDRITKAEYVVINKTSDATAKRDLKELVIKKIFNILGTGTAIHYTMSRYEPIMSRSK